MNIRVLIVDDQRMVRDAFSVLLDAQPDLEVVGVAENGLLAIAQAVEERPDVILMDVRMPVLGGIEATRRILKEEQLDTKVLMLTTFDLDEHVYDALHAGASGFLLKDASGVQLAEAIRTVREGQAMLAPTVTRRLITEFTRPGVRRPGDLARLSVLTPRETEVLRLIARGLSNAEIAEDLVVAEETVKSHVSRVLDKLGLRDRTQAAVLAHESGLMDPDR
ncbi:response regulator transcription factor [Streptomyces sp. NPDC047123]|uniref:response regulator transcription factor n=1 Tax=Streptomyces sp. NPDC047123 TaxID=3155622 RepID=UPI0033E6B159